MLLFVVVAIYVSLQDVKIYTCPWKLCRSLEAMTLIFFLNVCPNPIEKPISSRLSCCFLLCFYFFPVFFLLSFAIFIKTFFLSEQYSCAALFHKLYELTCLFIQSWVSHAICVRALGGRGAEEEGERRAGKNGGERGGPLTLKSGRQGAMQK